MKNYLKNQIQKSFKEQSSKTISGVNFKIILGAQLKFMLRAKFKNNNSGRSPNIRYLKFKNYFTREIQNPM